MAQTIFRLNLNGSSPVTVGGTGVSQKVFPFTPGPSIGVAATSTSPYYGVGAIPVPGQSVMNGQLMEVKAAGNFEVGSGGTCPDVTINLLAATSAANLSAGTYTTLATSGSISAQNLTGTFYPWLFDITLQGDSASGIVQGYGKFLVDNSSVVLNTLTSNLSSINFASSIPFYIAVGVTFSVSESGNSANMYQFELTA